jgi:hypothetical protein
MPKEFDMVGKSICLATLMAFPSLGLLAQGAEQCTTALVTPAASASGRPMLWKNRDTDALSNKVILVKEVPFTYLALVDADDASGRRAYAGLNAEGFAIMNTVAYNLPGAQSGDLKDLEGSVMADALRTCRTVADFEAYLKANQGPGLGCQTNFGVFDATGRTVLFEVHNRGFSILEASEPPEKYLINSNWSRSGRKGKGAGYLRFERATELFRGLAPEQRTPQKLFSHLARDTGHVLLQTPTLAELKALPAQPRWILTKDCINKSYTSCAVVLVGKDPKDSGSRATFWILPGEPVTAVALPLWVEAGSVPEVFWKGKDAPLWIESLRIKQRIRPFTESEKQEYLDLAGLDNREGTGFLPRLLAVEDSGFRRVEALGAGPKKPAELAALQEELASAALMAMKSIKP